MAAAEKLAIRRQGTVGTGIEPLYRIADVAGILHISRASVYNLLRGEIIVDLSSPGKKGMKLVPESTLNQIIARCKKRFL
jgi:hypothetical protein